MLIATPQTPPAIPIPKVLDSPIHLNSPSELSVAGKMLHIDRANTPVSGITVAFLYMSISVLLILFNRAASEYYHFNAPNLLTLSQTVCSFVLLYVLRSNRVISFADFNMKTLRRLAPLGLAFAAYMVLGMYAIAKMRVPMYTTLRRCTVVFVMILEYIISSKISSTNIQLSVCIQILGALIAGYNDLSFDITAYAIVLLYNFFTALYLVLINAISTEERRLANNIANYTPLDKYDFMYYNNLINLPLLFGLVLFTGETQQFLDNPYWDHFGFHLSLFASSILAFLLNMTIFWNTAVNSALTQTVSGQAKDVAVVLLSFILFQSDEKLINIIGITIGFIGSVMYGYFKMIETPVATVNPTILNGINNISGGGGGNGLLSEHLSDGDEGADERMPMLAMDDVDDYHDLPQLTAMNGPAGALNVNGASPLTARIQLSRDND